EILSLRRRPIRSTNVHCDLACPFLRGNHRELRAGETSHEGRSEFGLEIRVVSRLGTLGQTGQNRFIGRDAVHSFVYPTEINKHSAPWSDRGPPLTSPFQ